MKQRQTQGDLLARLLLYLSYSLFGLGCAAFIQVAHSKSLVEQQEQQEQQETFTFNWKSDQQASRTIHFQLITDTDSELKRRRLPSQIKLYQLMRPLLYQYAQQQGWYQMEVALKEQQLVFLPHSRSAAENQERIHAMQQQALYLEQKIYQQYGLIQLKILPFDKILIYDHATLVQQQRKRLEPLARAFFESFQGAEVRFFVQEIAYFLQSFTLLPIQGEESFVKRDYTPAYKVLQQQAGNADSKAVLMAALIRNLMPNLGMALVYTPDHAFLALALQKEEDDLTILIQDKPFVVVDPNISPGSHSQLKVGKLSPRHALYLEHQQLSWILL